MAGFDLTFGDDPCPFLDPAPAKLADPVPFYVLEAWTTPDSWVDHKTFADVQHAFDALDDLRARGFGGFRVVRRWRQP